MLVCTHFILTLKPNWVLWIFECSCLLCLSDYRLTDNSNNATKSVNHHHWKTNQNRQRWVYFSSTAVTVGLVEIVENMHVLWPWILWCPLETFLSINVGASRGAFLCFVRLSAFAHAKRNCVSVLSSRSRSVFVCICMTLYIDIGTPHRSNSRILLYLWLPLVCF